MYLDESGKYATLLKNDTIVSGDDAPIENDTVIENFDQIMNNNNLGLFLKCTIKYQFRFILKVLPERI